MQTVFLDTHKISLGRLIRALNAETPGTDRRGKMTRSSRKTDEIKIRGVREHILSLPAFESHYTQARHTPGRKYLSPELDIRKMYSLYVERCEENNQSFVKEWVYRKTVNTELNLNFHAPRKDTCQKCDLHKGKIEACNNEEEKLQLRESHDVHLQNAERVRNCLAEDQKRVK